MLSSLVELRGDPPFDQSATVFVYELQNSSRPLWRVVLSFSFPLSLDFYPVSCGISFCFWRFCFYCCCCCCCWRGIAPAMNAFYSGGATSRLLVRRPFLVERIFEKLKEQFKKFKNYRQRIISRKFFSQKPGQRKITKCGLKGGKIEKIENSK